MVRIAALVNALVVVSTSPATAASPPGKLADVQPGKTKVAAKRSRGRLRRADDQLSARRRRRLTQTRGVGTSGSRG